MRLKFVKADAEGNRRLIMVNGGIVNSLRLSIFSLLYSGISNAKTRKVLL